MVGCNYNKRLAKISFPTYRYLKKKKKKKLIMNKQKVLYSSG